MTNLEFVHIAPPARVLFGAGALARLPSEVSRLGRERVMLITSGSADAPGARAAADLGGLLSVRWEGVKPHVPEGLLQDAARQAAHARADVVVSIGGGSATGLAKAVAAAARVPVIAIPTTYSGSETTAIYGVTSSHKVTRRDEQVQPRVIIYDPLLSVDLPARVTAASGFNALAHCVETLSTMDADPVSALYAREAIRLLPKMLRALAKTPRDVEMRAKALYGAYLAGRALAGAGTGPQHKICHVLGGDYGLGHAETHAALLPHVAAHHQAVNPEPIRVAAQAFGTQDLGAYLADLALSVDAPNSLADLGIRVDALDDVARRAAASITVAGFDKVAVRAILDDAWHGRRPKQKH